jgi:hypothetical protein
VNVASTTEASGTTILTASAYTFDGGPVLAHFFAPVFANDLNNLGDLVVVSLFEGSTQIGRFVAISTPTTASHFDYSPSGFVRFTPSAASHTYKVTAFATSTTGTPFIGGAAGGTGTYLPCFLRFTKV